MGVNSDRSGPGFSPMIEEVRYAPHLFMEERVRMTRSIRPRGVLCVLLMVCATQASAGPTLYGTGGTLGAGAGMAFAVGPSFDLRAGYAGGSLNRNLSDTNISYEGRFKASNAFALADWYPSASGGWHLTLGAVYSSNRLAVSGRPKNGTYEFNGVVYAAPPGASVDGELRLSDGLVPYVGIGWSRRASLAQGLVFRGEIGATYQSPRGALNATGIPGLTQADIEAERRKLEDEAGKYRWYPVLSISVGYGF